MGIPMGKLICASNENKVLTDFINTGCYDIRRDFYLTNSPSMDILVSSNLERLLFEMSGQDDEMIRKWMTALNTDGVYSVDALANTESFKQFNAYYADDKKTGETIKSVYDAYGYVMDTHTGVGMAAILNSEITDTVTVLASTASPYKFAEDVLHALGSDVAETQSETEKLHQLQKLSNMPIPASLAELEGKKACHTLECSKSNMDKIVIEFLKK
jgi:threonine synthase